MKLLFWTDPHMSSMRLAVRKDDYPEAIFQKVSRVMELAVKEKVDLILCGGDLYHTKRVSKTYENRVIKLLCSIDIPQACVVGNHDIWYADASTVERSPLGTFFAAHAFTPSPPDLVIETDDAMIILLPYSLNPTNFNINSPKTKIIAGHYFLETGWDDAVLPPELTKVADYILLGHDHVTYPIERRERALIGRPGSLSRGSRHEPNWHRPVLVAILDTDAAEPLRYVEIPHAPADEIFSRERIEAERTLKQARILDDLTTSVSMGEDAPEILASMQMSTAVRARVDHWLREGGIT